ncbi:MAG: UvrD-helicase domain-containing protein [Chloroflexota bacterium]
MNEQQKTAVSAPLGPLLVLAGPGSGKTRVLTHRIVYLIQEMGIEPWRIMAVTFTNKASKEMRYRIEELLGGQPRGLTMGTFHATCARILRQETESLLYYGKDFVIFDTTDQLQVVKQSLKDLNLDDKKFRPNKMLNGISSAKNEMITPDLYASTNYISEINKRVYERYQEILVANNAMDFDDLLMITVELLDTVPEVLQKYQERYQYILVDEFQDTNTAQYGLLRRLAAVHNNILAVGDSDQSIYKWRGADYRNIGRFRETYPTANMILLEQNYRSTQIILDAAKAIISHNSNRVHKDLFTERKGGEKIVLREAYDEQDEAETIVSTIQGLMINGRSPGDCAVMYRTNAQSRSLEEAFVRMGLPYRLVGATQFYKRREVKDIIAYMRLVHNPLDQISFARVINTPTRGIGNKSQQDLREWGLLNQMQPAEATVRLATDPAIQHPFRARAFKALSNFGEMLSAWIQLRDQVSVSELMDLILEQTGYRAYIDDDTEEGRERWDNVQELRNVAVLAKDKTLTEFLEEVSLVAETDDLDETINAATLLTLHAAKGLEFPVVFLAGLEDGVLPHSRSFDDMESMAEERRLFYVGVTRAKDKIFLSHAFRRTFFGETEVSIPSRFLRDIPIELVEGGNAEQRRKKTVKKASTWNWNSGNSSNSNRSGSRIQRRSGGTKPSYAVRRKRSETRPTTKGGIIPPKRPLPTPKHQEPETEAPRGPVTAQYQTGQRVRHAKFGEGTVIESRLTGNDEEVSVAFAGVGIKRLAASYAKLEVVE